MTSPESPNNNPVTEAEMMKEENTNVQVTEPVGKTGISLVSLMVEDLRHRKWMLVLSSVVQLLMGPFATIFILSRYHNWYNISDHEMLVRAFFDVRHFDNKKERRAVLYRQFPYVRRDLGQASRKRQ